MVEWQWLDFGSMPGADLYEVLRLRQEVFVIEQQCFYSDMDGFDQGAFHLLGWLQVEGRRTLAAYLRCIAPGVKYPEMSLGRVVTSPAARGGGLGRQLVAEGIRCAEALHPGHRIRIGAQAHLENFYGSFGFQAVGEPYDEDGIPHLEMLR
ncbi:GNAT family N-acetyltransferase [Pseudoduganella sp. DS3]|uniref:GNAT family N-acetyltransferase n=1 Tax=Pseudoduganella guangdongensis TaxID=2692179 RepID=A0A6N9HCW0_9BURK|nr:GNAT family N-acetyltransferase [Pseudoduganella guangdongensis]MYN01280.1 GNAT family N-acetyltransferase [Pseudoduganella guangdongensis]